MASTDNAESRPLPFKKQLDKAAENAEAKERPPSPPNPIVKKSEYSFFRRSAEQINEILTHGATQSPT
jgi:hypothetical protein